MKRDLAYLKFTLPIVNVVIFLQGLALSIETLLLGLSLTGKISDFLAFLQTFGGGVVILEDGTSAPMTELDVVSEFPTFMLVLGIIEMVLFLGVTLCIRKFLKNIKNEDIFVPANVKIAKTAAILLLANSFLSTEGMVTVGVVSNGDFNLSFINITYLLAALLVWTISKVLEQANAIAEENDFTI